MITKKIKWLTSILSFLLLVIIALNACSPIRNLTHTPVPWNGSSNYYSKTPVHDPTKKTVFILADYKVTEMFDMLAPFYLFNATAKANVYIIAKDKTPILIKRNFFLVPQITFHEADSMKLQADVIVIPALSIRNENQDTVIIDWIKSHCTSTTKVLAICDGASTAAATGLYDGKAITCHASDYINIKSHFSKPNWIQNVSVTKAGNLFSTAGVSNAVEGSLVVINELFGNETCKQIITDIQYPYSEVKINHKSKSMNSGSIFRIAMKVMFRKNKEVGLFVKDGINEFDMVSILDTYSRTFPSSFAICNPGSSIFKTKYGLTLVCTANTKIKKLDELHVLTLDSFSKEDSLFYSNTKIITYKDFQTKYPIDVCLKRISNLYGRKFENVVKLSLDYN